MMSLKKSYGVKTTFEEGLSSADVLSLDIFDTCLFRRVGHPTHVFRLMEHEMRHIQKFRRLSGGDAGFSSLRVRAERQARQKLTQQGMSAEATFDEIYQEFQIIAQLNKEDIAELMLLEMSAERKVLTANPQILQLATNAQEQGKQVIYVSDMYLPEDFIAGILKENGFPVVDGRVFVSGQYRASKWVGDLYDIVAKRIDVPFSRWFHVGDNDESDVKKASQKGIKAYHYPKLSDIVAKKDAEGRKVLRLMPTDNEQSLALGLRNANLYYGNYDKNRQNDFWYQLGFERGGILILGFVNWLIDQCLREKNDVMVFLARDGYILKRCFDLVCEWRGLNIKSVYMYASRKALQFPALIGYSQNERNFLLSFGAGSVAQYLDRCDLNPADCQREIIECGFTGPDDMTDQSDSYPKMCKLFVKLHSKILNHAADQSRLVIKYLDELQIPTQGHIGLVDIGWYGSMQESFQRFMRLTARDVQVNGYYLGLQAPAKERIERGQKMKGYLTYIAQPESIHQCVMESVELIEFLHLAPHGTCLGFEETEEGIRPILPDNNPDEQENVARAMMVHEGVMQFFKAVQPIVTGFPHMDLDAMGAFYPYAQTINDPTIEEAQMLGGLTHAQGFGTSALQSITDPKKPVQDVMWKKGAKVLRKHNK